MGKRLIYLATLFITTILVFVLQKPFFMLYNGTLSKGSTLYDYWMVMWNGIKLDSSVAGYLFALPFLFIFVSIWYNKVNPKKCLAAYYILISLLMSLVFIVDMALYEFWDFKLDATIFTYLDSPANAMASVSTWFIVIRFLAILILASIYTWLFLRITPKSLPIVKRKISGSLLMLLIGGLIFIVIRGGTGESTSNVGRVYFSEKQFLNHAAVNPCFSLLASLGKSEDFAGMFNYFAEEERSELLKGLYPHNDTTEKTLLKTARPNILIIQLESFGGSFVEAIGGEPGITPNLNRLSKEGVLFTNCYATSFRSDRGTVSVFSGYPGLPTTSVMKLPIKSQTLPAIAKSLERSGYKTDFLYGGDIDFTNMQSYFRSTGYQNITSDKDFTLKERHTHAWGVNDDITFDYLYNVIKDRKDSLWHTGFFTLSSHDPFVVPYNRFSNKVTNAIAYTDDCLGKFIDKLKQTPAWDNLLIICIADHGYTYPDTLTFQKPAFYHIPMLWLGGAIKAPEKINKIMSQTDLAATLLGQLNLPIDDFSFSRNIFSPSYTYPFAFSTYNNGILFRDSTGVSVYDNNAGRVIEETPFPNELRIKRGKAILQSVYDNLGSR